MISANGVRRNSIIAHNKARVTQKKNGMATLTGNENCKYGKS